MRDKLGIIIDPSRVPSPGSCVMRLNGIEYMSQKGKTKLLRSISDDLRALLMCIGQHVDAGNLDAKTTAPLDEVIRMIRDTEIGYRRSLERGLRRSRKQKRWLRREYRGVVRSTEALARAYKTKVQVLKDEARGLRVQIEGLEDELEMLRLGKRMGKEAEAAEEEKTDTARDCGELEGMVEMESGKEWQGCDTDADVGAE